MSKAEAAELVGITKREVGRRITTGELASIPAPSGTRNGKRGPAGRLVRLGSMPPQAKEAWLRKQMNAPQKAAQQSSAPLPPDTLPKEPRTAGETSPGLLVPPMPPQCVAASSPAIELRRPLPIVQPDLFWSDEVAALAIPAEKRDLVSRRLEIVRQCLNGDYRARGLTKDAWVRTLASEHNLSARTLYRLVQRYETGGKEPLALLDKLPGPEPSDPAILQDWQKAEIQYCWISLKLNIAQTYDRVMRFTREKANSAGWRNEDHYEFPSIHAVRRYIRERLTAVDHALRGGAEAIKAAAGYIDRTYRNLASLSRVETDEWKCDFLAYHEKHTKIVRRWWLLTFYDERSLYPLEWELVAGSEYELRHGIGEADEINLLVRLVEDYGAPDYIVSDHGRFRGKTFVGGKPGPPLDESFKKLHGIFDELSITKSEPREKNPRGNRLERFHRFLADSSRSVPGWIGSNTKQRKIAPGDGQLDEHHLWLTGERAGTPLLSRTEAIEQINTWMETWRAHESRGTDMDGLSPRAVFVHNTPATGFRRISDAQLAWATAEHFPERTIQEGGIIELPGGGRYSHPHMILIQGEKREVARLRHDHSQISVLPAAKGEEIIFAPRRVRVGTDDPDELAKQTEMQRKIRNLCEQIGKQGAEAAPEGGRQEDAGCAPVAASDARVIGSPEFFAEREKHPRRDVPALHELEEFTPEMEVM